MGFCILPEYSSACPFRPPHLLILMHFRLLVREAFVAMQTDVEGLRAQTERQDHLPFVV